jgi:endonuclease/exonuclease/phosphatase family metal-dependent hydrolase
MFFYIESRPLGMKDVSLEANGKRPAPFPLDRIYLRGLTSKSSATYCKGAWKKLSDHAVLLIESEIT